MMRWEYLNIECSMLGDSLYLVGGKLNRLGSEGWEMIAAFPRDYGTVFFFKRPLPTTSPPKENQ